MKGGAHESRTPATTSAGKRRPDIDRQIGQLARKGAFENSGLAAIEATQQAGRPATILEGDTIVRLFPDGRREVVKKLDSPSKAS